MPRSPTGPHSPAAHSTKGGMVHHKQHSFTSVCDTVNAVIWLICKRSRRVLQRYHINTTPCVIRARLGRQVSQALAKDVPDYDAWYFTVLLIDLTAVLKVNRLGSSSLVLIETKPTRSKYTYRRTAEETFLSVYTATEQSVRFPLSRSPCQFHTIDIVSSCSRWTLHTQL